MTDDNLDTLIDAVAQEMTATPTDSEFARRVSRRIADAGERRRSWFRPWVLVPIAAAIVLLVMIRLTPPDATRSAGSTPGAAPDTAGKTEVARVDRPGPAATAAPAQRRTARPPAPMAGIQPVGLAPIEIDPIAIEPLVETNVVQITPIAIDRIEISAMP